MPRDSSALWYQALASLMAIGSGIAMTTWWLQTKQGTDRRRKTDGLRPLVYRASMETSDDEERSIIGGLGSVVQHIHDSTWAHSRHAVRATHAKSHGLLFGTFRVLAGLPHYLAQGLFAEPRAYDVVMRLSTQPGDILPDSASSTRGMALKVIGVTGERLPGSEGDATQDFLMQDSPVFHAPDAKSFLRRFRLAAAESGTWKEALSSIVHPVESIMKERGGLLRALGGRPSTHILGETFYTQAPLLYGRYMAKLCMVPVSGGQQRLIDREVDLRHRPDGLREEVVKYFHNCGAMWEMRAQLCTDLRRMPIEDALVPWPERESPYVTVARITVPPQEAWSEARSRAIDDGLSFSPWHGLAAHRPLGSIMRARRTVYELSEKLRAERNRTPIWEPDSIEEVMGTVVNR